MTFAEADAQYKVIKQQYLAGELDDEQFDAQLHDLMVLDEGGRWWAKSRESGDWFYHDVASGEWVAGVPPTPAPATLPKPSPSASAPSASASSASAKTGGETMLPKWAAVNPTAAAPITGGASAALPGTAQGAPATAAHSGYGDFTPMPELSGSLKVIFYILSLLLPVLGIVLYFIYRNKPAQADRSAARAFLILGIASFVFSCMCSSTFIVLESAMLGTGA